MKYIKEFHSFAEFATYFCSGLAIWGFIDTFLRLKIKSIMKKSDENTKNIIDHFLYGLHNSKNIEFKEQKDGFYATVNIENEDFDVIIEKDEKKLVIFYVLEPHNNLPYDIDDAKTLEIQLNDNEYANFLKIIKR